MVVVQYIGWFLTSMAYTNAYGIRLLWHTQMLMASDFHGIHKCLWHQTSMAYANAYGIRLPWHTQMLMASDFSFTCYFKTVISVKDLKEIGQNYNKKYSRNKDRLKNFCRIPDFFLRV